ncbi:MAG: homoserine kinase [Bdellovibrionales bacterium]|nr:homoserine kinase [Bdellovibrionales bacterium]
MRSLKPGLIEVSAYAPATVANLAVGFDILGMAIDGAGDTVTLTRSQESGIRILEVKPATGLTLDASSNTATAGLLEMISDLGIESGFEVVIEKGIPLSSGMGGSAASAVAGIVALNAFLESPVTTKELIHYALIGESVASGSRHGDNVVPALLGGLQLTRSVDPVEVLEIPLPEAVHCVVVHPSHRVDTKMARSILRKEMFLKEHVRAAADLATLIHACHRSDLKLIGKCLRDNLIEPQRMELIPGFMSVKKAAMEAGALGCSISGSGPSVFAWFEDMASAEKAKNGMIEAFKAAGLSAQGGISKGRCGGARVTRRL